MWILEILEIIILVGYCVFIYKITKLKTYAESYDEWKKKYEKYDNETLQKEKVISGTNEKILPLVTFSSSVIVAVITFGFKESYFLAYITVLIGTVFWTWYVRNIVKNNIKKQIIENIEKRNSERKRFARMRRSR